MPDYKSLTHTRWDCKYHVVFIPKKRQKVIYGQLRQVLGDILHELASRKGAEILEGHMMRDHIHMCISIPPKYSVSHIVGYIKGKRAIAIARKFRGRQRNFNGEHFWARGYFVSTVGLDEDMVREYIRNQEQNDERRDQMKLGISSFGVQNYRTLIHNILNEEHIDLRLEKYSYSGDKQHLSLEAQVFHLTKR